jgi:hypothetical protein
MKVHKRSVLTKGNASNGAASSASNVQAATNGKAKHAPGADAAGGPTKPEEMSPEVLEFIQAMDDYRVRHGRPFPSWSEVLDVLMRLGYRKVARSM